MKPTLYMFINDCNTDIDFFTDTLSLPAVCTNRRKFDNKTYIGNQLNIKQDAYINMSYDQDKNMLFLELLYELNLAINIIVIHNFANIADDYVICAEAGDMNDFNSCVAPVKEFDAEEILLYMRRIAPLEVLQTKQEISCLNYMLDNFSDVKVYSNDLVTKDYAWVDGEYQFLDEVEKATRDYMFPKPQDNDFCGVRKILTTIDISRLSMYRRFKTKQRM